MRLNCSSDKRPSFKSMIKFENLKFSDLEVLETIAETHAATTKIYLTRHQGQLQICKVALLPFRPYPNKVSDMMPRLSSTYRTKSKLSSISPRYITPTFVLCWGPPRIKVTPI